MLLALFLVAPPDKQGHHLHSAYGLWPELQAAIFMVAPPSIWGRRLHSAHRLWPNQQSGNLHVGPIWIQGDRLSSAQGYEQNGAEAISSHLASEIQSLGCLTGFRSL